jgi:hypothetical protein
MTSADTLEAIKIIAIGLSLLTLGAAWFYVKGAHHD